MRINTSDKYQWSVLYALYKYLKPEKMILDTDSDAEDSDTEEAEEVAVDAEIAVKNPEERVV